MPTVTPEKIAVHRKYYTNDDLLSIALTMLKAARDGDGIDFDIKVPWLQDNLSLAIIEDRMKNHWRIREST